MSYTNPEYTNVATSIHGFRPIFLIVGYTNENEFLDPGKEQYYLEIADIVDNKPNVFQPMTKSSVKKIHKAFDIELNGPSNGKKGWFTDQILYADYQNGNDVLIYWEKSGMQTMSINGKIITLAKPSMIFMVKDKVLYVFAYDGDQRPTSKTMLYRCPFANSKQDNSICLGSALTKTQRSNFDDEISYWQGVYWKSEFTATIGSVTDKYSLQQHKKMKRFLTEWMYPLNINLEKFIETNG